MHDNHSDMNCKWPPRAIVRQCVTQRCLWQVHSVPWACSEAAEAIMAHTLHVGACAYSLGGVRALPWRAAEPPQAFRSSRQPSVSSR